MRCPLLLGVAIPTIVALATTTSSCKQQAAPAGPLSIASPPARVVAKQTVRISTSGSSPSAVWFVNGKAGGSAESGTIDGGGYFVPPAVASPTKVQISVAPDGVSSASSPAEITVLPAGVVDATKHAQVASYTFSTDADADVAIEFGETTSYGKSTWARKAPGGGGKVTILVAGMRSSTSYHMRAVATFSDGSVVRDEDHVFASGRAVPDAGLPHIAVTRDPLQTPQPGVEMLDLTGFTAAASTLVTDLDGHLLWSYDAGLPQVSPNPIKLRQNGNFLINYGVANLTAIDGLMSLLREVDLTGNEIWSMNGEQLNKALSQAKCKGCNITIVGTHHDFVDLPNGHVVVLASQKMKKAPQGSGPIEMVGDVLIDLDEEHKPVWVWSAFDHPEALDINRHPMGLPDWLHSNAILYSPSDGALLLSIRHQHWIVRIDYANGKGSGAVTSRLGWQGDYKLVNGTDPEDWFYAQHGPSFVGAATSGRFDLVVFDNGDYRQLDQNGTTCNKKGPCSSRVSIWGIDEAAKTATMKWVVAPPTLFAFFGGNAEVLPNGHVEYDDATLPGKPSSGVFEVTQELAPVPVWGMQIGGQYAYRAYRMPSLYPGVQW